MSLKLVRLANKLDSLGKTKEADKIDFVLLKNANRSDFYAGPDYYSVGNNLYFVDPRKGHDVIKCLIENGKPCDYIIPSEQFVSMFSSIIKDGVDETEQSAFEKIQKAKSNEAPQAFEAPKDPWEKYIEATKDGAAVKEAFRTYALSHGKPTSFGSFVSWYNWMKKNIWHSDKSPLEVVGILKAVMESKKELNSHTEVK